ncbi:hypothetical protein K1719_014088 [Acacia pycnantha]|nr:hypothetical protein K1719_014088 [Acacia pycnantha]
MHSFFLWPWVDCEKNYVSSTYKLPSCDSPQCSLLYTISCGGDRCSGNPENTITSNKTFGDLSQDVISVQSTNGFYTGEMVTTPKFTFLCGSKTLVEGLPRGVTGMAALGRSDMSLPSQFASIFTSLPRKFAICLSSSTSAKGAIFFGSSPYHFLPNIDVSKTLTYTPLIANPVSTAPGEPSFEYFIGVNSIRIGGERVDLNTTLLSINKQGFGGTKISTVNPYTVMETSIYIAVRKAFIQTLGRGIQKVTPIAPFSTCFASKDIVFSRMGPNVPTIELVLQNEKEVWSIAGANSMVQARNDVICLGFVDAGLNPNASLVGFVTGSSHPRTSITIGSHQLENNLLQFDLTMSRLGFSNSLLSKRTNCGNFNFTSNV